MENYGKGYITVNVRTAGGALPVSDATIVIKSSDGSGGVGIGSIVAVLYSDISGTSDVIGVPAPSRSNSLSPEATGEVCSFYDIETERDGFYPITNSNVPVYDGVTSIQEILMMPSNAGIVEPDGMMFFDSGKLPDL